MLLPVTGMRAVGVVAVGGLAEAFKSHGLQGVVLDASAALYAPSLTTSQVQVLGCQLLLLAGHLELGRFTSHELLQC